MNLYSYKMYEMLINLITKKKENHQKRNGEMIRDTKRKFEYDLINHI